MTRFVALRWATEQAAAQYRSTLIEAGLQRTGWSCVVGQAGWRLWCLSGPGRWMLHRRDADRVLLIGRLFDRAATERDTVADADPTDTTGGFETFCRHLVRDSWGSYVALCCDDARPDRIELFRDPVGAMECTSWLSDGVRIVASHPETVLSHAPPAGLHIDWARLADILLRPATVSDQIALAGIDAVPPGTLVRLDGLQRRACPLWAPASVARTNSEATPPRIRDGLVDSCVRAWTSCSSVAIAELSGGLDSAIVAAGAITGADTPVRAWFNYHVVDAGGDERRFAAAIAERLGVPLEMIACPETDISERHVDTMPIGLRPGFGSSSIVHDIDLAARAKDWRADMLLTGNGGDAVFFQDPSPLIAADLCRSGQAMGDRLSALIRLARWTGRSVWSLGAIASGLHRPSFDLPESGCSFLAPDIRRHADPIPWLADADGLLPAKRLQILHLAIARSSFGSSWCGERLSVVHPLMSQPILDHVLPIPAITLTDGRRDRALARAAYADRLPAMLIDRRGKGCLTAYLGRRLARSTAFLKEYLLGGVLVSEHVIDPVRLEPILDPDFLMHTDRYAELLLALLAERWARVWSDRCRTSMAQASAPERIAT